MTPAVFDPGRLRHRVTLAAPVATPDGAGGETVAWSTVATVWAAVEPVAAAERRIADHLAAAVTHRVILRWRGDVTGGMRATHRGRNFRILAAIDPDERRRFLLAEAAEETA
jgi:SPP1 family predicted phage head-tail adaptor